MLYRLCWAVKKNITKKRKKEKEIATAEIKHLDGWVIHLWIKKTLKLIKMVAHMEGRMKDTEISWFGHVWKRFIDATMRKLII